MNSNTMFEWTYQMWALILLDEDWLVALMFLNSPHLKVIVGALGVRVRDKGGLPLLKSGDCLDGSNSLKICPVSLKYTTQ